MSAIAKLGLACAILILIILLVKYFIQQGWAADL